MALTLSNENKVALHSKWKQFLGWGIGLSILGLIAMSLSTFTTLVTVILLGILLALGGAFVTFDAFASWWKKWPGFFLHLIMGILYLSIGLMMMKSPILGSMSLTLLLGIFYVVLGTYRSFYAVSLKYLNWGWSLFSGLITLILGILILAGWPSTSLFVIGLFIGIDLFFYGLAYVVAGLKARHLST